MNLTVKWLLNVIIMLQWQFIFGTCGHFIINAIFWTESSYKREMKKNEKKLNKQYCVKNDEKRFGTKGRKIDHTKM